MTQAQKTELVSHHNTLRGMEGADNMELMVLLFARKLIYTPFIRSRKRRANVEQTLSWLLRLTYSQLVEPA